MTYNSAMPPRRWVSGGLVAVLLLSASTWAQLADLKLTVAQENMGLGGMVRPGQWTPILAQITNQSSTVRQARLQWVNSDIDGDQVLSERVIRAVNAQSSERFWIYACPPMNTRPGSVLTLRLLDEPSGELLATQKLDLRPAQVLPQDVRVVGVVGSAPLGLEPYLTEHTHQEATALLRSLSPRSLPDRWYGLSVLESLIWLPPSDGASENDVLNLPDPAARALRHWIKRGGHLVVVLPAVYETWSGSPLKDLLPASTGVGVALPDQVAPTWLGRAPFASGISLPMRVFDPGEDTSVSVLLKDTQGRPVVVAHSVGLGRVTLVGVDLTDPRLLRASLPQGDQLWRAVFGWRGPAIPTDEVQAQVAAGTLANPDLRAVRSLDRFIASVIAMRETAAPAMLAAVLTFGLYWLAAGPVSYAVLRAKGQVRHSWTVFVLTALAFSALTWGGASVLRPRGVSVKHFSVIDVEAATGLAHTRAWAALFVPRHESVQLTLEPSTLDASAAGPSFITSAGLFSDQDAAGFLDPRSYSLDAGDPSSVRLPMRATAKQIEIDHLTRLSLAGDDAMSRQWLFPSTGVTLDASGWPVASLVHHLPGDLRDCIVIFAPGQGRDPWVWRVGAWKKGSLLALSGQPAQVAPFLTPPLPQQENWGGFLGTVIARTPGAIDPEIGMPHVPPIPGSDDTIYSVELLSFFNTLPPPDFRKTDFMRPPVGFARSLGRALDLTPMLAQRRLIVMGHLEDSPLPAPLRVEGREVQSTGWTVVRWSCPIP